MFRGGAKTARTKLFIAYIIANDIGHFRKYFKVLASDIVNSKQITTDIYNMFVSGKMRADYPEIFRKTDTKREETMGSFTTSTGIKVIADTVGTEQRGAIQEEGRPDFIWFEDFENRKTLRSAVITKSLWDNMEEARTGLAVGGSCIYTCNYISEAGNVHKLTQKQSDRNIVLIVPIIDKKGVLAWPQQYPLSAVKYMEMFDDDYEGERLCEPSASADIIFDRTRLNAMDRCTPIRDEFGFKIFYDYDPQHFYASGHDIAGGVGLDSSTSVFIDFSTEPKRVVATYASNTIKPENFGEEIVRQQLVYGRCVSAPENNMYTEAILRMRQLDANIYVTERKDSIIDQASATEFGWKTTGGNKSNMLLALSVAVQKGWLELTDPALIAELEKYTRNDLMDRSVDPRLTTRHFDLLMAVAIAWQMKDYQPVFFPKTVVPDTIDRPLNHGWVQNQTQQNIIEQTYLL